MKIAHLADIHIRNVRYHERYEEVFDRLYDSLREEDVDLICVLGDIAHTKESLSAEYFEIATKFLRSLSSIAKTIVIPGNHDANLTNLRRQDSITPIVEAMENENLVFMKYSASYSHVVDGVTVTFHHLSVFDDNWNSVYSAVNKSHVNIGMYHGPVNGSSTDAGFKLESHVSVEAFADFDFTFLGDIHKRQLLGDKQNVLYPGSLIQQNYGESAGKGYSVWNIVSKAEGYPKHIELSDPTPFVTYHVTKDRITSTHTNPPVGCYARFMINDEMTTHEIQRSLAPIFDLIKPKDRRIIRHFTSSSAHVKLEDKVNYRDPAVQKKLLQEFCIRRGASQELVERVNQLHDQVMAKTTEDDSVARNVTLDLDRLEFDNLFSYGAGNVIDFSAMRGVIGIFGPNAIGKSSIVDSILLCAFNGLSRRIPSPAYAVNNRCDSGAVKLRLSNGETSYLIERDYEWKESKAEDASERGKSRATVKVTKDGKDLSGENRQRTDKDVIQKEIGSLDDYITTSVSPQDQIHRFVYMTDSPRKDYLINILDLGFFDEQLKVAKELSAPVKARLGKGKDESAVEADIELAKEGIVTEEAQVQLDSASYEECRALVFALESEIRNIEDKIDRSDKPIYSVKDLEAELAEARRRRDVLVTGMAKLEPRITTLEMEFGSLPDVDEEVENARIAECNEQIKVLKEKVDKANKAAIELRTIDKEMETANKLSSPLSEVPCGDQFPGCKFISNAHTAKKSIPEIEERRRIALEGQEDVSECADTIKSLSAEIEAISTRRSAYAAKSESLKSAKSQMQVAEGELKNIVEKIELTDSKIVFAAKQQALVDSLEEMRAGMADKHTTLRRLKKDMSDIDSRKSQSLRKIGSLQQKIDTLNAEVKDIRLAREEMQSHELLLEGLSRNGLVQQILEELEPRINAEINEILADSVNFQVIFDLHDPKFRIYLEEGDRPRRYIELASGFERMVSSLAIRVALIKLSTLPKFSTLVIDEGFGALDDEHRLAVTRLFDALKSSFKNIVIITHIDSIKDAADHVITIEVDDDGYSHVNNT